MYAYSEILPLAAMYLTFPSLQEVHDAYWSSEDDAFGLCQHVKEKTKLMFCEASEEWTVVCPYPLLEVEATNLHPNTNLEDIRIVCGVDYKTSVPQYEFINVRSLDSRPQRARQ